MKRTGNLMPQRPKLDDLLTAQTPCVSITTFEEDDALQLVRDLALETGREMWAWSMSHGIHDPLIADSAPIPDTAHPAAALYYLTQNHARRLAVFLDRAGHLKDERTLRQLRDLIATYRKIAGDLILIDHADLP